MARKLKAVKSEGLARIMKHALS